MSVEFIKYAFIAGEVSGRFFGRSDLEKFDLGLAEAYNCFIDYRGGLSNRPGTEFGDYIMDDDKAVKTFAFEFAPDVEDTYLLLFGDGYIRFIQDNGYVLEDDVAISDVTEADPGVITVSMTSGYATGDWIKIASRTFEITNLSPGKFSLQDPFGNDFDTTGETAILNATVANRIYTVTSPYAAADLAELRAHQARDTVVLTHKDYDTRELVRSAATSWALSTASFGNDSAPPANVTGAASGAGSAGTLFAVTAQLLTGEETRPSDRHLVTSMVDYTNTAGHYTLKWDPVTDAEYYKVYRALVLQDDAEVTLGAQLGFLGHTFGTQFTDNNIIPDYTTAPPQNENPFAPSKIVHINVTAGGSGYVRSDTISVSGGGGSGFIGFPIVGNSGEIQAIVIENGGEGYSSPTVSVTTSGGSGATFDIEVGPATGLNPRLAATFQQRRVYASSIEDPLNIWASHPGQPSNFDISFILAADDSYDFTLDSEQLTPIEHLVSTRTGLLIMTKVGIWQLTGGSDQAVTPINALAEIHNYTGVGDLPPIRINTDIIYSERQNGSVRLLEYNQFSRLFRSADISVLSNHLFSPENKLTSWSYAESPFKLAYAVREDGSLLMLTIEKDQEIYAWTKSSTRGLYKDVTTINEGTAPRTYFITERYINGRWTKFFEREQKRSFTYAEDAWFVDCGLQLTETKPAAGLTFSAASGTGITVTADSAVFTGAQTDKILRAGGGKFIVTGKTSDTVITVRSLRPMTDTIPETDDEPLPVVSGEWTLDTEVTEISGLWHLEGMSVAVLADGNVVEGLTVSDGAITLTTPATRVMVGLGYTARAKSLPLSAQQGVIEARRKRTVGLASRVYETRGVKTGPSLDRLVEMKDRTNEVYGEPTALQSRLRYQAIPTNWDENGQVYMVQDYPLPMTILGYVLDVEVGDDPD